MSSTDAEPTAPAHLARWLPLGLAVVACALGSWLRLRGAGSLFLWSDEQHSLAFWQRSVGEILSSFDPNGSGLALPLLQHVLSALLGPSLWAVRLPALLGGVLGLLMMYPVVKRLVDSTVAALAALLLALNPLHIFFSHFARAYTLATLLCLMLLLAARRVTQTETVRPGWYVLLSGATALLPFVHLTSGAVIAAVALAAAAALWASPRPAVSLLRLGTALGTGAIGAVLLHLPSWSSFSSFVADKAGQGPAVALDRALDAASVLAGGRAFGGVWLLCLPTAAALMMLARGRNAFLPVATALVPIPILLAMNPLSGPYALARYMLPALPAILAVLAWGWVEGARTLIRRRPRADVAALLAGSGVALVAHWAGPLGWAHVNDGPYANIFFSLRPLPVFDAPFAETPDIYRELAERSDVHRIIEAPALPSAGLLLYRNYFLQHRKETWMGTAYDSEDAVRGKPFVWLGDPKLACASGADVLVFHRNPEREVSRYWDAVYGEGWKARTSAADRPFMVAFTWVQRERYVHMDHIERRLRRALGEPSRSDEPVVVWELDRSECESAG